MTSAVPVHPTNSAQLRAWDGDEGAYWARHADRFERSIAGYNARLFAAAAITASDRVVDVGCGTGGTTRAVARIAPNGSAHGVDLSAQMIELARRRAADEGLTNATFDQADAQIHPFPGGAYDVAISRTGAMFFGDPVEAFANIRRALVPHGRLALVTWQRLPANEWIREISGALAAGRAMPTPPSDAPGPFALSDPDRVRTILSAAGFTDIELDGSSEGMWFGADTDDAAQFLLGLMGWMLHGLDASDRARAVEGLHTALRAHETANGVVLGSAAWTIRAERGASS